MYIYATVYRQLSILKTLSFAALETHIIHMFTEIIKRDGSTSPFDAAKITLAIEKAMSAAQELDEAAAQQLTDKVVQKLSKHKAVPNVEDIQDAVEETLMASTFKKPQRHLWCIAHSMQKFVHFQFRQHLDSSTATSILKTGK